MNLEDVDLFALQTKKMKEDPGVHGFSTALNDQFRELSRQIGLIEIYSKIDQLSEPVLDLIAWQFNIDWYNAESDIAVKRKAIKDTLLISRIRGTPAAVQRVIEIYFGNGRIEEWFDYGGDPYTFRVITNNRKITGDQIELFTRYLESVKNIRSKLDEVIVIYFSWNDLDATQYNWDIFDKQELTWDDLPSWTPTFQASTNIALTFSDQ